MKIKYESVTGEVTEVEVSEEIGAVIIDSRRKEENLARKERYHCYSLDAIDFEGLEYSAKEDCSFSDDIKERVRFAFSKLSPVQKRRLNLLSQGKSMHEISEIENVAYNSVFESINAARKNFLKFF